MNNESDNVTETTVSDRDTLKKDMLCRAEKN